MRNIMIIANRGSGKDTLVDYIQTKESIHKIRLANYVEYACAAFGIYKPTKNDLVKVGTEIGRKIIGEDVWIKLAQEDIDFYNRLYVDEEFSIVVTDVRFRNEYEYFLSKGYFPIVIYSNQELRIKRVKDRDGYCDESLFNHQSETELTKLPGYVIVNNGTIDQFKNGIDEALKMIKRDRDYNKLMCSYLFEYYHKKD